MENKDNMSIILTRAAVLFSAIAADKQHDKELKYGN